MEVAIPRYFKSVKFPIPILEYCSPVWCPHLKKDIDTLEKAQLRASKCALGNIGRGMSYEERLTFLKWPTLQQRRLLFSLTECYKTINRFNGLDSSSFFMFIIKVYYQSLLFNFISEIKRTTLSRK